MSRPYRPIQPSQGNKLFLRSLAVVYVVYLVVFGHFLYTSTFAPAGTIVDHTVNANADGIKHWTPSSMRNAADADQQVGTIPDLTQGNSDTNQGKAVRQQGQRPRSGNPMYPLSTVGRVFFTNSAGQDSSCSGTAVVSLNQSIVDTAGHCLYWNGGWVQNLIFCPLYENGNTPYGCWAARDLEVPADWIHAGPNDFHHDFGMAIVSPNSQGALTDLVGGSGWAYNQPANQVFSAYGYPARSPFDGQRREACEDAPGTLRQHAGNPVVSIPCGMTGGSSGGPWFIKINGNWYVNGHNDFTTWSLYGHMFSPYYDNTWYTLYDKAQHA
ncbi:MAG: peptidase [Chloroflexota bacterium]|nr:peptidase [Chloroflexota bacterium]